MAGALDWTSTYDKQLKRLLVPLPLLVLPLSVILRLALAVVMLPLN